MNPKALAIVTLRSLATLFALNSRPRQAESLQLLAAGVESGVDVDEHMRAVAQALQSTDGVVTDAQWDDVHARIEADSARLQAR